MNPPVNIADLVEIRDERWCWPKYDKESYQVQIANTTLFEVIEPFLRNRKVMVQAGGNCGVMLEKFVLNFETVYTFEPDPLNFYCLTMNLPYANLIKFQACVGHNHAHVSLNNGLTTNIQDVGAVHINEKICGGTTPTMKIDDLELESCDLIQLDIEGFEGWALEGAIQTIQKHHPVLCLEMNPHWARRYKLSCEHLETAILNVGYKKKTTLMDDRIYVFE